MARTKGDLMRSQKKKVPGRKSFPNLNGANLTREEIDMEIHLQIIRIRKFLGNYGRQVKTWLDDIERHLDDDRDAL